MRQMIIHHGHLSTSDTSADIRHTVVIPDLLMLIVRITLTILRSIHHDLAPVVFVLSNQRTAPRRCNHLIAIERQYAILTKRTQRLSLIARAKSFSRILYDGDTILIGNLHDTVSLVWHTVERYRHDSLRRLPSLGDTVFDSHLQQFRIHVPRIRLRIDQHRRSPQIRHRVRRSTERKALHNHLISRLHATVQQPQMHRRRPRRQRHHPFAD